MRDKNERRSPGEGATSNEYERRGGAFGSREHQHETEGSMKTEDQDGRSRQGRGEHHDGRGEHKDETDQIQGSR